MFPCSPCGFFIAKTGTRTCVIVLNAEHADAVLIQVNMQLCINGCKELQTLPGSKITQSHMLQGILNPK